MKATGNIVGALPNASAREVFEPLWQEGGVLIERIVSRGQRSAPGTWYEQDQNEWVLLVKGAARLCWEDGSETALSEGDYVAIPAMKKHRVEWTDPNQNTIWLAIHFCATVNPSLGARRQHPTAMDGGSVENAGAIHWPC